MSFLAIIGYSGIASDRAPAGARKHRVKLLPEAVSKALPTLIGKPLKLFHEGKTQLGVVWSAVVSEGLIIVSGTLTMPMSSALDLGASYELREVTVADVRQEVWLVTSFEFEGVAVLPRQQAAHTRSVFLCRP